MNSNNGYNGLFSTESQGHNKQKNFNGNLNFNDTGAKQPIMPSHSNFSSNNISNKVNINSALVFFNLNEKITYKNNTRRI